MSDAYGFKRYFRFGPVQLNRVRSWDRDGYTRVAAWRWHGGFTVRYRGLLLVVTLRRWPA